MDTAYFKKLFEYDDWANEKILGALESMPSPPEEALKKLGNILIAKAVWLSRLPSVGFVPPANQALSAPECRKLSGEIKSKFQTFFVGLSEGKLSEKIAYKDFKGADHETLLSDILTHSVTHGPYHRGQIASLIKKSGGTPPATDFILYVRE